MLGLPDGTRACLFDLDGVLTDTAAVHDAAWKDTFDAYLRERSEDTGEPFVPFDPEADYSTHVDGRPRLDGVRAFLASRGIDLPEGSPDDALDQPLAEVTVTGLGNRKDAGLRHRVETDGVEVFEGSRRYLQAVREEGLRCAVVSSSANTEPVLRTTGLEEFVQARVDGRTLREEGIAGKPAPDSFLAGAAALGIDPSACAVFEDAVSGVRAGRAGGFGIVIGVDRTGDGAELLHEGADVVVTDLAQLLD